MDMSNLQIGLAGAGAVVLAGVVAHGAWVSRRNEPRQAQPAQLEPGLNSVHAGEPDGPGFNDSPMEPHGFSMPPPKKEVSLDALIDVLAPIGLEVPVSGEAALAAMPPTHRVGSKHFALEGQNAVSRHLETPVAGQRYSAFLAGVQLANRLGPLNEIEYSEFVMKTQAFADTVNGTPEFPEMRDEVARARELDQFAGDHDAQLGFTVRARMAAWSPGYVHQNAARLGFVPGAIAGRMSLPALASGAPAVLGLSFDSQAAQAEDPTQTAIREVTLSLDVAQVERSEQAFVRMREAAQALALAMDGTVTDDNGLPLPGDAMDIIGSELEKLYDTLESRDLAAGSPQARRLFS